MVEFKLTTHDVTGDAIVEVWVDGLFRAAIYPAESGIRIISRYVEGGAVEQALPDDVRSWSFTFNRKTLKSEPELFVVRLYDGMDTEWIDVSEPLSRAEAEKVWQEKTEGGTKNTTFDDIDYYKIFPADTTMLFSGGFGEH